MWSRLKESNAGVVFAAVSLSLLFGGLVIFMSGNSPLAI